MSFLSSCVCISRPSRSHSDWRSADLKIASLLRSRPSVLRYTIRLTPAGAAWGAQATRAM